MDRMTGRSSRRRPSTVVDADAARCARATVVAQVYVDDKVKDYIVDVVFATREPGRRPASRTSRRSSSTAPRPRASICLNLAARAHAFLRHRGYVTPEDVKAIGLDVLRHRVVAHLRGRGRGGHRRARRPPRLRARRGAVRHAGTRAGRTAHAPQRAPRSSSAASRSPPRALANEQLAGQYHSVFKGRGMAFPEVRPYQPGDDVRAIDWNVSARMNEPFVKVFAEEREMTVMLLVDLSASERFGTRAGDQGRVAAEVGALLAFSAIRNNDRVGPHPLHRRVESSSPRTRARSTCCGSSARSSGYEPRVRAAPTSSGMLETLSGGARRRSVAFVVSDFFAAATSARSPWPPPSTTSSR